MWTNDPSKVGLSGRVRDTRITGEDDPCIDDFDYEDFANRLVNRIHDICSAYGKCSGSVPPVLGDEIIKAERLTREMP